MNDLPDLTDGFQWAMFVGYVVISEIVRRKKLGENYMSDRIKLERELAAKDQREHSENDFKSYQEIDRFMVSKYKIYKNKVMDDIEAESGNDEKADGVTLNCVLKVENKLRIHLVDNHFDKLEMTDLESYLDYITNESIELIESYLKNRKLIDTYMKYFSYDDVRKINLDIIHTAINIKKRIASC